MIYPNGSSLTSKNMNLVTMNRMTMMVKMVLMQLLQILFKVRFYTYYTNFTSGCSVKKSGQKVFFLRKKCNETENFYYISLFFCNCTIIHIDKEIKDWTEIHIELTSTCTNIYIGKSK